MAVSTTVYTAKINKFGIVAFVESQETNWRGNLQGSKCDGDCIFLWKLFKFYQEVPSSKFFNWATLFTKKAWKFATKRTSKKFLEVF